MHALFVVSLLGCTSPSDDLEARVAALEDDRDALQAELDDALALIDALEADVETATTDIATVDEDLATFQDRWIMVDTIWTVGSTGQYATLAAAWTAALYVRIWTDATLTLQLLDGTHALTGTLVLNHPDGANIEIVGSGSANVTVTATGPALAVDAGHHFGRIAGLTVQGPGDVGTGLVVHDGRIHVDDVVLRDFSYGATVGPGLLSALGDVVATSNLIGVLVDQGGILAAVSLDASGNDQTGVRVTAGILDVATLDVGYNGVRGAFVLDGGIVRASTVEATEGPIVVQAGSVFISSSGTYGGTSPAFEARGASYAFPGGATFAAAETGMVLVANSTVDVTETTFEGTVVTPLTVDATSLAYDP